MPRPGSPAFALHASAPDGMLCADCQIDGTPCRECLEAAACALKQEMDWLDLHCSVVADHPYKLGPFRVGGLRLLAQAGLAADKENDKLTHGATP